MFCEFCGDDQCSNGDRCGQNKVEDRPYRETPALVEDRARRMYDAFCASSAGVDSRGAVQLAWSELPELLKRHWCAAALVV